MNLSVNGINLPDKETRQETTNDVEKDSSAADKYLITSTDINEENSKHSISENKDSESDVKAAEKIHSTIENTKSETFKGSCELITSQSSKELFVCVENSNYV